MAVRPEPPWGWKCRVPPLPEVTMEPFMPWLATPAVAVAAAAAGAAAQPLAPAALPSCFL